MLEPHTPCHVVLLQRLARTLRSIGRSSFASHVTSVVLDLTVSTPCYLDRYSVCDAVHVFILRAVEEFRKGQILQGAVHASGGLQRPVEPCARVR